MDIVELTFLVAILNFFISKFKAEKQIAFAISPSSQSCLTN